jgi:DNA-binding GntR family transcriptional regulator
MADSKAESLTNKAYKHLRNDILSCRLNPGQKLVISVLVAQLGYSLGAIREALSRLTSEGLVVSETNKGFRVAPITQADLEDLTRVRVLIEVECLNSAIEQGDLAWESGIVASLFELSRTQMYDSADPERVHPGWQGAHARFHTALVAGCNSPWLLRLREQLYSQSERYRSVSVPLGRRNRDVGAEHQAIADAALARDKTAATAAMRSHLEQTTRILIEAEIAGAAAGRAD